MPLFIFFLTFIPSGVYAFFAHGIMAYNAVNRFNSLLKMFREGAIDDLEYFKKARWINSLKLGQLVAGVMIIIVAFLAVIFSAKNNYIAFSSSSLPFGILLGILYAMVNLYYGIKLLTTYKKSAELAIKLNYRFLKLTNSQYQKIFLAIGSSLLLIGITLLIEVASHS